MELRKKVKLVHGTIMLILISFIAFIAIGVVSLVTSSSRDDNFKKVSKDGMSKMALYDTVNVNNATFRYELLKFLDRPYSEDTVKEIQNIVTSTQATLTKLDSWSEDSTEKEGIKAIKDHINTFIPMFQQLKDLKIQGKQPTLELLNQLANYGDKGFELTEKMVKYQKNIVDSEITDYNNTSSASKLYFFIAAGIGALLLLIISVLFIKEIKHLVNDMLNTIKNISSGDFTSEGTDMENQEEYNTEFGMMNKELNLMKNSVGGLLRDITDVAYIVNDKSTILSSVSEEMLATSQEVSMAINEVATGSTSQSGELMAINNSIKSFGRNLEGFVGLIVEVNKSAGSIGDMANASNGQLEGLRESLSNIDQSFDEVISRIKMLEDRINQANEITGLINSISEQTNLLALNAAIEAARAGETGKGFSVVAEEIRKLADQSRSSSEKISELLNQVCAETSNLVGATGDVSDELSNEVTIINSSIASFKAIVESVEKILPGIENVSVGINGLNADLGPVLTKVADISNVSESNSASSEEIAVSSQEMNKSASYIADTAQKLTNSATRLKEGLDKFKL